MEHTQNLEAHCAREAMEDMFDTKSTHDHKDCKNHEKTQPIDATDASAGSRVRTTNDVIEVPDALTQKSELSTHFGTYDMLDPDKRNVLSGKKWAIAVPQSMTWWIWNKFERLFLNQFVMGLSFGLGNYVVMFAYETYFRRWFSRNTSSSA